MSKVYVLTAEGYFEGYGSKTYLIGVYDDLDKLTKAQDEYVELLKKENLCPDEDDENIRAWETGVLEVELNETHQLSKVDSRQTDFEVRNGFYISGYIE